MAMIRVTVLVMLVKLAASVFDEELHEKYIRMPEHEFIEYFNSQGYSWNITKYGEDVNRNMGAYIHPDSIKNFPVQSFDSNLLKDLPKNFDSRQKWPNCKSIKEINDQGDCGSCWTFGSGNTASDRTCIHKDLKVHLSEQDFECMQRNVCEGGDPFEALNFWKKAGLVTKECKPYNIDELHKNKCVHECVDKNIDYAQDKHYAEKVYRVSNESNEIKAELFHFGPIQAGFKVFEDFRHYGGGIYEHKYGRYAGRHSVRIIGYGVEGDKEFWLVANSWGPKWGENGLFRVKAYEQGIGFEELLATGIPKK